MNSPLEMLVAATGSRRNLATLLGLTPQAISKWRKRIPVERVLEIEARTGVSRHDLRPDIYPREHAA